MKVNPRTLAWAPKVHNKVQLDEIYQLIPDLATAPREMGIKDSRFPALRQILHTSLSLDLSGLVNFKDFVVYHDARLLSLHTKNADPKKDLVTLFDGDQSFQLSERSIINTGYLVGNAIGLKNTDIVCTTLMPHTSWGLSLGLGMVLAHHAKIVYASQVFSAPEVANALATEFCSCVVIEAGNLDALLTAVTKAHNLSELRAAIVVSYPGNLPSADILEKAREVLGLKDILVTFGVPQSAGVLSMSLNHFHHGCVGQALPHTKVSIASDTAGGSDGWLATEGFHVPGGSLKTNVRATMDKNKDITLVSK